MSESFILGDVGWRYEHEIPTITQSRYEAFDIEAACASVFQLYEHMRRTFYGWGLHDGGIRDCLCVHFVTRPPV